jgi:hypothetical protein
MLELQRSIKLRNGGLLSVRSRAARRTSHHPHRERFLSLILGYDPAGDHVLILRILKLERSILVWRSQKRRNREGPLPSDGTRWFCDGRVDGERTDDVWHKRCERVGRESWREL